MAVDSRKIFIRGERVLLAALDSNDVHDTDWYGWFNDEKVTQYLQQHRFPVTLASQVDYLDKLYSSPSLDLGVWHKDGSAMLGVVSLKDIDSVNRSAELSTVIGASAGRDFNIFLEVTKLMLNHGFSTLNLNRIQVGTIISELVDVQCKKFGFVHEGTMRNAVFKNGKFHDSYVLGCLSADFFSTLRGSL